MYWMVFIVIAALLLGLAEVGFRVGRHPESEKLRDQVGGMQAAVLGLLGLLIGFTFAMAVSRYDQRRLLIVKEANAIGTTYLRASMLPAAHQAPVRDALRRYVNVRIQARADDPGYAAVAAGERAAAEIQREIWQHATAASNEAPTPITATFIVSLNEMIDVHAERWEALHATVPYGVWGLLIVVAAAGALVTGIREGNDGIRTILSSAFLPLLITFVIMLVVDLSHPLHGFIGVNQQPLLDLQQSMVP